MEYAASQLIPNVRASWIGLLATSIRFISTSLRLICLPSGRNDKSAVLATVTRLPSSNWCRSYHGRLLWPKWSRRHSRWRPRSLLMRRRETKKNPKVYFGKQLRQTRIASDDSCGGIGTMQWKHNFETLLQILHQEIRRIWTTDARKKLVSSRWNVKRTKKQHFGSIQRFLRWNRRMIPETISRHYLRFYIRFEKKSWSSPADNGAIRSSFVTENGGVAKNDERDWNRVSTQH